MITSFAEDNHLVLVDGYSFLFRAYHSMPALTNSEGVVIGAVYGYSNMILKLKNTLKVSHLAVIFDHGEKTFRNEIYDQYKANRPPAPEDLIPQFPLVRDVTNAMNIKSIEKKGYEADDLIATISKSAKKQGINVTIVSSDKDLTQLVDDQVKMYDPMKQKVIDKEAVHEKYGVYPAKMLDLLSLTGDSADNIPGVPSIGPKTAAELLNNYNTLDGIYENLEQIKQPKRKQVLTDNKEQAMLSRKLVELKYDVEIDVGFDDLLVQDFDLDILKPFFEKHGFNSLISKVGNNKASKSGNNDNVKHDIKIHEITKIKDLESSKDRILKSTILITEILQDKFYICTEKEVFKGNIAKSEDSLLTSNSDGVLIEEIVNFILPFLCDATIVKIFPDFKRCYRDFISAKKPLDFSQESQLNCFTNIVDLEVVKYLLPKQKQFKTFDYSKTEGDKELSNCLSELLNHYHNALKEIVKIRQYSLLFDIDLPINLLLPRMEDNGFKLDQNKLFKLTEAFQLETSKSEKKIFELAGTEFNIASPKQLAEILFDKLKIESKKKSKKTKSLSTSVEVLEELSAGGYEIADHILTWRHFTKLKNTYTEALPKLINNISNRVHSHFSNTNTSTGRLSSNNPNLQNIPVRSNDGDMIREAFICDEGNVLISADYSQIELRLLSHYAKVAKLQKAFHNDNDIHAITASEVFGLELDKVDSESRRKAKTINFGIIYGISSFGLAKRLGIKRNQAKEYIDLYFDRYPEIKTYMKTIVESCQRNGFVETVMNRKLFFPELISANSAMKGFLERAVINAPLQGSASDIVKKAMLDINSKIISKNLPMKLLLQVHDELIYEVPKDFAEEGAEIIKNGMEKVIKLDVPLDVSVSYGNNWKEIH